MARQFGGTGRIFADYSPSTKFTTGPNFGGMSPAAKPLQKAFGQVLRDARKVSGYSQEQLALAGDLDRTFVSLLERGLRQPSLQTLVQIAQVLGVRPGQLVDDAVRRAKR